MSLLVTQTSRVIIRNRWLRNFVMPNYTPSDWFEADVFELTPAGYFREYEIKLNRKDFFKDRTKTRAEIIMKAPDWDPTATPWPTVGGHQKKHDLLAAHDPRGPRQFWFVTPPGILKIEEIPEWAGFIVVDHGHERELKKAPCLHKVKAPDKVVDHARVTCYYRMHRMILHASELQTPEVVAPTPLVYPAEEENASPASS